MGKNTIQKNPEFITDFGERKVNSQNFSKTVVLPKQALSNCGCDLDKDIKVNISLVQKGDEKFIKISPVSAKEDDNEEDEDEDDDDD